MLALSYKRSLERVAIMYNMHKTSILYIMATRPENRPENQILAGGGTILNSCTCMNIVDLMLLGSKIAIETDQFLKTKILKFAFDNLHAHYCMVQVKATIHVFFCDDMVPCL